ncbi:TetR/AcrR family transcriptional regulator [Paracoccus aminophilus]|nr:TetR/AcrR family transcriptional regulator [Paracoccus aminophilus]
MIRPTKAQIDAAIIDRAAGLFARHGFTHTSIQQIADAVGYSKAGLLHHFPSKQAIYDAVLDTLLAHTQEVSARVSALPPGRERDLAVIEAATDFNFEQPGIGALGNSIAASTQPDNERLKAIGTHIYASLAVDLSAPDPERLIRISVALAGVGIASSMDIPIELKRAWRPFMIASAMGALGY